MVPIKLEHGVEHGKSRLGADLRVVSAQERNAADEHVSIADRFYFFEFELLSDSIEAREYFVQ